LLPALLLMFWLGARGLNADMIWWDEHWSLDSAGAAHYGPLSPIGVAGRIADKSIWDAPGYYMALNLWGGAVGWTPFALRALSLMCGLLAVAFTFRLGADLGGGLVGMISAFIMSLSGLLILYLHELRPYAMSVMFAAGGLWAYWRLIAHQTPPLNPLPANGEGGWSRRAERSASRLQAAFYLQTQALSLRRRLESSTGQALNPLPANGEGTSKPRASRLTSHYRHVSSLVPILFTLSSVGLLYTHYYAALALAAIALYHLILAPKRVVFDADKAGHVPTWRILGIDLFWWRIPLLLALAGLAFVPWLGVTLTALQTAASSTDYVALSLTTGEIIPMLIYGFSNGANVMMLGFLIPVFILARKSNGARYAAFMLTALLLLTLGLNLPLNVIKHIRHVIVLLPPFALAMGFGVAAFLHLGRIERVLGWIFLTAWLIFGLAAALTPTFHDTLFRAEHLAFYRPHLPLNDMADEIAGRAVVGDAAAFASSTQSWAVSGAFDYTMHPLPVHYTMADWLPGETESDYSEQVRRFLADDVRLWFGVESNLPVDFRQQAFEAIIADEFALCERPLDRPDLRLELYARDVACCAPPEADPVIAYGAIDLAHVAVEADESGLDVLLSWSLSPAAPRGKYSVARHVLNADGDIIAQLDSGLPLEAYRCERTRLDLPDDLAAGEYTLNLIVYDWQTGDRLSGQSSASHESGDNLTIFEFSVE
jgi:hypothetical protein